MTFELSNQFIQFGYIQEDLQIPFISVCGLAWTCILSVLAGAAKQHTETTDDENVGDAAVATMVTTVGSEETEEEEPYCVIGLDGNCVLPDDLFPHATLEDVKQELSHELEEITHLILHDYDETEENDHKNGSNKENAKVAEQQEQETSSLR